MDVLVLVVAGELVEVADLGEELLEAFLEDVLTLIGGQEPVGDPV
ncbi:hypothetical protein [Nonomuraea sp. NPDC049141]